MIPHRLLGMCCSRDLIYSINGRKLKHNDLFAVESSRRILDKAGRR